MIALTFTFHKEVGEPSYRRELNHCEFMLHVATKYYDISYDQIQL